MEELVIDKRLQQALNPLTHEEFRQLEQNCLADGAIRESIKLWGSTGMIVDGHNRYKIAKKHDLPYVTEELDFNSIDEAILWAHKNQAGRRNLYGAAATTVRANIARSLDDGTKPRMAVYEEAGEIAGVSGRTIRRDVTADETISKLPEDIGERIRSSDLVASRRDIEALDALPKEDIEKVCAKLRKDKSLGLHEVIPKKDKKKHNLSEQDLAIVDEHWDKEVAMLVHRGTLKPTTGEISKLMGMRPEKRQCVFDMICADAGITTITDAIRALPGNERKKDPALEIAKKREQAVQVVDKLIRLADDIASLQGKTGGKPHESMIDSLKVIRKHFSI
jgi:hypothetical protein